MNNKILVTYASRAGSTAEVAEAIGKTLTEGGAQVDVIPMQDVNDLSLTGRSWRAAPSARRGGCLRLSASSEGIARRCCINHLPCLRSALRWRCRIASNTARR